MRISDWSSDVCSSDLTGADGAVEGRQGEPRSQLRERPVRLGLCAASGPHIETDDPVRGQRAVARGELGRSHSLHRERVSPYLGAIWNTRDRRHYLEPLHQERILTLPHDTRAGPYTKES